MDRDRQTIREEAFELDPSEQAQLAEEIVENLAKIDPMKHWIDEAKGRLDAYRRGEMKTVDPAETFAKTRKMIEDARGHAHK